MAISTKSGSKTSPKQVLERAKAEGVNVVDVREMAGPSSPCGEPARPPIDSCPSLGPPSPDGSPPPSLHTGPKGRF